MESLGRHQAFKRGLLSSALCSKCGRVGTRCSCYNGLLPALGHALYMTGSSTTSVTDEELLDFGNEEASAGSDLDLAAPMCEKSDQHNEFIEMEDFDINCLPDPIRHPSVVSWLWNCMALVVRLYNSKNATGRVVYLPTTRDQVTDCKNDSCPYRQQYGNAHKVYGGLAIITNKHVVKNDQDAKRTQIDFFYHNPDNRQQVLKERGMKLHSTNQSMDYTLFTCTAHNTDLIEVVKLLQNIVSFQWRNIPPLVRRNSKQLAIVISHPHGTAKKISIGQKIKTEMKNDTKEARENSMLLLNLYESCMKNNGMFRFSQYYGMAKDILLTYAVTYYTTATCRGSSGAPVYMGNTVNENGIETNPPHTHRGKDPVEGYNVCFT